jgi:NAD(P)-dependent dehydrogenase (short-subunit alcohol dehydrogenase family)
MGTYVITGGSQGIGAAFVRLAAQRGHKVGFSYGRSKSAAESLAAELGANVLAVPADAADEGATIRFFQAVVEAFGPLDGFVNNAGITGPFATIEHVTPAIIDEVFAINVRGAFIALREAARHMPNGGAIVNISSRASGIGGGGEWVHYAASKGAIDSFTIGASRELAAKGIRVNAINPGLIDTDIHAKAGDGARVTRLGATVPLGRAGTAEEVARVALWLLSDEASYITGALLPVSGGR